MDLRLFFRVLKRFWFVATVGFLLAAGLAFLSYFKVDRNGLHYRAQETWISTARVLIASDAKLPLGSDANSAALAPLYASLVSSDPILSKAIRAHGIAGGVTGQAAFDNKSQAVLPIVYISAVSTTPTRAAVLANDAVTELDRFISAQQTATNTPETQRVHLQDLNSASPATATVATPRSKTRPILVLVLGLAATLGLVLILENLRPRLHQVKEIERAA